MTASFKRNIRERLASLEREILRSLQEQHEEYEELTLSDRTEETDEAAIRNEERALSALLYHEERRLLRVRSALGRIEEGHYGVCASCGTVIADDRLAAQPDAVFCYDCARRRERGTGGAHLN
ncbi:MAG: TraR/DksA family transcriptional regulator [Spirochaetota bacterium]